MLVRFFTRIVIFEVVPCDVEISLVPFDASLVILSINISNNQGAESIHEIWVKEFVFIPKKCKNMYELY